MSATEKTQKDILRVMKKVLKMMRMKHDPEQKLPAKES